MRTRILNMLVLTTLALASFGVIACKEPVDDPAPSSNAELSALSVSAGTLRPSFSPAITGYSVDVPADTASITVTGVAAGTGASVGGANGVATELKGGANAISVVVTAADGTTKKTYTVTAYRAKAADDASNADLSYLGVRYADLYPEFSPSITEYTAIVSGTTPTVTLVGTCANKNAKLGGDYNVEKSLVSGPNKLAVTVTAPDGTTVKTYSVVVTRSTDKTPPKLTACTLSPTRFNSNDGDVVVKGTITAEDDSGIGGYNIVLDIPNDYTNLSLEKDTSSTLQKCTYNWSYTVRKGRRGGEYKIRYIKVADNAGNTLDADLAGYTISFFDEAPVGDTTPPKLINCTLDQTEVNSSDGDVNVGGSFTVQDESGIWGVGILLDKPHNSTNISAVRDEKDPNVFHWSYTILQGSRGGTYRIRYVTVRDNADNVLESYLSGYSTSFVDNAPPGDVTPPTFVKITVETPKIDSSKGNVTVKGTVVATDDESGVRWMGLDLIDPSGHTWNTNISQQVGGDPKTNAVFDWSITVKQGITAGEWKIYNFYILDEELNYLRMNSWDDIMKTALFVDSHAASTD